MINLSVSSIAITIINIIVLFLLLKKFLIGPINKIMAEREEMIKSSIANRMIKDAEKTIEVQREKALSDMESQVAELAMSAAAKILGEDSNDAKNQSLYDEFIEKAGEAHDTESN